MKNISVGADGRVWGVNSKDQIYTREGVNGTWRQIEGNLKQVHVSASGRVWGVNSINDIYTRPGVEGTWQKIPGNLIWVASQ